MIQGISHITLVVKNLEKATLLFTDLLGGEEVYSSGEDTFSLSREKFFTVAGQWFAVMEGEVPERSSYEHIAFKIEDADLKYYEDKIKAMGLALRDPRPRVPGEGQSLYFYDADGHLFELHTGTLKERLQRYRFRGGPVKSQIVFRGTEAYHFTDYFKKHAINNNGESYELMDVWIAVEPMPPHIIGRLKITQVALNLQGEALQVQLAEEKLKKHFMTAGG